MATPLPSRARLEELFTYEPHTGALVRSLAIQGTRKGDIAGSTCSRGYVHVFVDRKNYYAHRLIWKLVYGEDPGTLEVDHIDGDRSNNRLENLRLGTSQLNNANRKKHKGDLPKGVQVSNKKFAAQIKVNGVSKWLGTFDTPAEAHSAYCKAAADTFGQFARAA